MSKEPRYDEVFEQGTAYLDSLATPEPRVEGIPAEELFSKEYLVGYREGERDGFYDGKLAGIDACIETLDQISVHKRNANMWVEAGYWRDAAEALEGLKYQLRQEVAKEDV